MNTQTLWLRATVVVAAAGLIVAAPSLRAQTTCTAVGKDRWTVKTEAPATSSRATPIAMDTFATLPAPAMVRTHVKGAKTSEVRYPDLISGGLHEGELVRITGWVRFIKLSSDDCDYHIQVTPDTSDTSGMVIVEIPDGDAKHEADTALRAEFETARDTMVPDLHLKRPPGTSGSRIGKAYMTFEGALFFDAPHYPHCDKRGVGMAAATCWEIHPVTAVRFAPRP
jgi:hypothetical protein